MRSPSARLLQHAEGLLLSNDRLSQFDRCIGALALPFVLAAGSALVAALVAATVESDLRRLLLGLAGGAFSYALLSALFNRFLLNDFCCC
jgi:hypothetical protein